jgi:hypothetical protein
MSHLPPWVKASSLRDAAPNYVFEPALLRGTIDLLEGKIA